MHAFTFQTDTDRLCQIVLEQSRNAVNAAYSQRRRKCARHQHVARLFDFAEQVAY